MNKRNMHILSLLPVLLISLILASCRVKADSYVIVAGSTSVQPYAEILAERYKEIYSDSHVEVQGGGSSAGITAVRSETADIGMSSRALKEKEMDLYSIEIAKDGLAVIVHPDNLISDLTLNDIQRIYSGEIVNWSELGGRDAKIHVVTREEGSGTRSAFEELVMGGVIISPKAIVQDSNGAVRQLILGDVNAIGYISLGLVDNTVKALKLDGVTASWESIDDGSYKLSRPFLFVCAGQPVGEVKDFIDFVMSDEGQKMLKDEGLVPLGRSK